jgi:hypothetical protein
VSHSNRFNGFDQLGVLGCFRENVHNADNAAIAHTIKAQVFRGLGVGGGDAVGNGGGGSVAVLV